MSRGSSGPDPPLAAPPSGAPPAVPQVDLLASLEVQAYLRSLKAEDRKLGRRNRMLAVALAAALAVLVVVLWSVYRATIGSYAVLADIQVRQEPLSPGRLELSYRVVSPGKVFCRRTGGGIVTELVDYYHAPCEIQRPWSWVYRPGEPIELVLHYRRGVLGSSYRESFATVPRVDIVVLIDTTGSMDPSIAELKRRCVTFAEQLRRQSLKPRFALIGFGDTSEPDWLDKHGFATDIDEFQTWVNGLQRFDGGDLPESALDALEEALTLPLDEHALHRFLLVTDADYHEPSRSGATPQQIAARLAREGVLLYVFSRPDYEEKYRVLLGKLGRFQEVENFGRLLAEGRVLED